MTNTVLRIKGLSKNYGKITAVRDLSLTVPDGSVYGLLGPNGSGKSTTLGVILGIVNASAGSFSWFDKEEVDENRKRIGAMLEQPNFYPYLTAYENLKIVADIKDVSYKSIDKVLDEVNLLERKHSKFKTFSLGMKQRLAIASVLLADPQVLVLDEPTNGLDPQGIAEVRKLIIDISKRGKTIIMASHILAEVERVCTHVAVLKKGKLLSAGAVDEIMSGDDMFEIAAKDNSALSLVFSNNPQVKSIKKEDGCLIIYTENVTADQINQFAFKNEIVLTHLRYRKQSLEAQFLEITAEK